MKSSKKSVKKKIYVQVEDLPEVFINVLFFPLIFISIVALYFLFSFPSYDTIDFFQGVGILVCSIALSSGITILVNLIFGRRYVEV